MAAGVWANAEVVRRRAAVRRILGFFNDFPLLGDASVLLQERLERRRGA
jgi:hypothetical protein